jgi:hypothetical protein
MMRRGGRRSRLCGSISPKHAACWSFIPGPAGIDRSLTVHVPSSAPPTDYAGSAFMQHAFPLWVDFGRLGFSTYQDASEF